MVIARAILKATLAGTVQTRNMFEVEWTLASTFTPGIQAAMVTYVQGILSPFLSIVTNLWVCESVQLQEYITGAWNDVAEVPITTAGTSSTDFEEFQTAVLLTARTGGLRTLGKKFFAGLQNTASIHGILSSVAVAMFASSLAAWLADPVSSDSYVGHPGVMSKSGVFWQFLGGSVGSILSTMRRRKPGYGI